MRSSKSLCRILACGIVVFTALVLICSWGMFLTGVCAGGDSVTTFPFGALVLIVVGIIISSKLLFFGALPWALDQLGWL